jgi:hypothetical protein
MRPAGDDRPDPVARRDAGLVIPELRDLSSDRGDGVRGVALSDAGIEVVARHPDGTVVLHWRNTRIPLGDPGHAAEHGPAVATAILAASSERS